MAKCEWLYCNDNDWSDIINIIKLVHNREERLREFHDMLKRDEMTIDDVIDEWWVTEKSNIEECVRELVEDDLETMFVLGKCTYWFFNIYTGEAMHIKCFANISYSSPIID